MFRKRNEREQRLAAEIEKLRAEAGEPREEKPRQVTDTAFFLRIREMQTKGGAGTVPLC